MQALQGLNPDEILDMLKNKPDNCVHHAGPDPAVFADSGHRRDVPLG
jgi:hypothetical protein